MKLYSQRWVRNAGDHEKVAVLAQSMGLFLPVAQVLVNRGIDSPASAETYLNPTQTDLFRQLKIPHADDAAYLLMDAVRRGQRILVYGDYDADGVTSLVILHGILERVGGQVSGFAPDRQEDGYGVHLGRLEERMDSFDLLITVDCGITATEAARFLKEQGKTMIVTDHHEPADELPDCLIVNPRVEAEGYESYAGAGVALAVAASLAKLAGIALQPDALGFAAIGTIADLMPLTGTNRMIAKLGLERIGSTQNIGLRALCRALGLEGTPISAGDVGYRIGPAINAAGRIDSADEAIRLFMTADSAEARMLSERLKQTNEQRKAIERDIVKIASNQVKDTDDFIIVKGENWHEGVVGIVASRLVERFRRPAIVLTRCREGYKGSGRSVGDYPLLEALDSVKGEILRYGGHRYAAGMTLDESRFQAFREGLNRHAARHLRPEDRMETFRIEGEMGAQHVTESMVGQLALLEPFGRGNPKPLFLFRDVKVSHMKVIGPDRNHLKLNLELDNRIVDAVGFSLAHRMERLDKHTGVDLVGALDTNHYLGVDYVNIYFKDFREHGHRTLLKNAEASGFIADLTSYVADYHLPQLPDCDMQRVTLWGILIQALDNGQPEVDLPPPSQGRIRFDVPADLQEAEGREWFVAHLIRQLPSRDDLVKLYRKLEGSSEILLKTFDESTGETYNCNMEILAAQVLAQLGLAEIIRKGTLFRVKRIPHDRGVKLELKTSQTYRNILRIKEDWDGFQRENPCDRGLPR